jgi:hypothetical protein
VSLAPAVFPALGTTATVALPDPAAMTTTLFAVQGEIAGGWPARTGGRQCS